jgi:hypothetical protein
MHQNRLPALKERPRELAQWLSKRNYSAPPCIEDISNYASNLLSWLSKMKEPSAKKHIHNDQPFQHLRKGGPNGIVTLLFGLKWWRSSVTGANTEWHDALQDVLEIVKSFSNVTTKRVEPPTAQWVFFFKVFQLQYSLCTRSSAAAKRRRTG